MEMQKRSQVFRKRLRLLSVGSWIEFDADGNGCRGYRVLDFGGWVIGENHRKYWK